MTEKFKEMPHAEIQINIEDKASQKSIMEAFSNENCDKVQKMKVYYIYYYEKYFDLQIFSLFSSTLTHLTIHTQESEARMKKSDFIILPNLEFLSINTATSFLKFISAPKLKTFCFDYDDDYGFVVSDYKKFSIQINNFFKFCKTLEFLDFQYPIQFKHQYYDFHLKSLKIRGNIIFD